MSKRTVVVGLVQHASAGTRSANVHKSLAGIRDAAARGAKLIVLQELFAADYFCQEQDPRHFELAEPLDGPTAQEVAAVARETATTVVVPLFERRAPGLYHNSLIVVGPSGETLGTYRKMHIPDDPQFLEKYYFAPGDLGFSPIDTPQARLGALICWDQWYPEAARLMSLAGAEILAYPTAIGWMPSEKPSLGASQLDAWRTIQRSHAIANGVFVVAVNRVGLEGSPVTGLEFWGHSFVCDPAGNVLAEAGEGEETLVVECELSLIEEQRRWWPFFRDRRVDAYGDLTERFRDGVTR